MKKACLSVILIIFVGIGASTHAQTPEDLFKAIVKIRAVIPEDARTAKTLGTEREGHGVLIDEKGLILTIGYLIVEAETIEVFGPDEKPISATFVGYDYDTGFGLLRAGRPLDVVPIKIGESANVKEGEPVLVAGHGGSDAVQGARIIARREFAGYWEYLLDDALFTVPPYANFGGAALIGRDGRLLGIGSLFTQLTVQGLGSIPCNMFVPIDLLQPILEDLITKGRSRKVPRPWLGINSEEAHGRVFITRLTQGAPAERAGLEPEDLILKVDGKPVRGLADFYRKVWGLGDAGVDVRLTILRGTDIQEIIVRSSDRYRFLQLKPKKVL
jgi:S1-C subfamily serine protease